jgi:hypothetical protein
MLPELVRRAWPAVLIVARKEQQMTTHSKPTAPARSCRPRRSM